IHRTEAERSAGRKLTTRERKELKEDLQSRLLPRILPSVALVDVLYEPSRQLVLLFGTAGSVREEFVKLFFRTFATTLVPADAHELAARAGLDRDTQARLEGASPVRWRRDEGPGARIEMEAEAEMPRRAEVQA